MEVKMVNIDSIKPYPGNPRLNGGRCHRRWSTHGQPTSGSKTFSAKATETLLEHVGEIPCSLCPTVGVGQDWRFEAPDIVGQALVAHDVCAHLGVLSAAA